MIGSARRPPGWALASSSAAVIFLVGGETIAGAVSRPGYDPVRDTISALAAYGAPHRWIMTLGLAGLGAAHLVTAGGLGRLRPGSRTVLGVGGAATVAVAILAQPGEGSSDWHIAVATIGFVALAVWPATTCSRAGGPPVALRPGVAVPASAVSVGLLIWVGVTLAGGPLGLAERLLTFDQALWPLVVVVSLRRGAGRMSP